jgi:hypothetical protein
MLEWGQYHARTFRKISTPLRCEKLHATPYDIYQSFLSRQPNPPVGLNPRFASLLYSIPDLSPSVVVRAALRYETKTGTNSFWTIAEGFDTQHLVFCGMAHSYATYANHVERIARINASTRRTMNVTSGFLRKHNDTRSYTQPLCPILCTLLLGCFSKEYTENGKGSVFASFCTRFDATWVLYPALPGHVGLFPCQTHL